MAALDLVEATVGVAKPDSILVADDVTRRYGGLTAVEVDHLEVPRGVITALIGPNGAGKTTFFNLLCGFDRADTGSWSFDGQRADGAKAHVLAQRGMVRTFQLTKTLGRMTVLDNMLLAGRPQGGEHLLRALWRGSWRQQEADHVTKAYDLLARFKLDKLTDEYAAGLSGGQRKLLEMARALMTDPSLVMLDEPMAGVNPALTQSLLGHVTALRDEGMSILFVEHDMDVIMTISDWVVCMAGGRIIAEGRPADIAGNAAVIEAYLGIDHGASTTGTIS
ncbi:ABC transporter ATP-binding protein [Aquihabitans sp. G128]|uniref:ABC transporter ATP-binding protein n=1 Tax=Aquihabitans sp. G128 TaxID=2849779 RepID=UPI001C244336|nr:ABC transporter ATP-binding protein [Aquihabitans sp. G128]